jgi:hypothetical protein
MIGFLFDENRSVGHVAELVRVPAENLLALLRQAGITVTDTNACVSLNDALRLDHYLARNAPLLERSGLDKSSHLELTAGYLPPRPPPPPPPEYLADCVGLSRRLLERWRRQYEYFADVNGLMIYEKLEPDFSMVRLRHLEERAYDLERQIAAQPAATKRNAELNAQLEKQRKDSDANLAAWRKFDGAVAEIKILETSRIARWGGICLGLYLGGIVGLYMARGFPAERAVVAASDLSAAFVVWLFMAPLVIAPIHLLWKLFATKREERLVSALAPRKPSSPLDNDNPKDESHGPRKI